MISIFLYPNTSGLLAFLPLLLVSHLVAFTTLGLSTMIEGIIKLMMSFLGIIMTGIGNMFATVFAGMGNSVVIMLQSFGFSAASYGILGPVAFVIGIGAAILVGYLFLVPTRAEEDVVQDEDDL
jgi:hypothetical protein